MRDGWSPPEPLPTPLLPKGLREGRQWAYLAHAAWRTGGPTLGPADPPSLIAAAAAFGDGTDEDG